MNPLHAVILGIIEGLTEFFPISSTAHLIAAQRFLGIHTTSIFFNTVIQLGAVMALLVYFWKDLLKLLKESMNSSATIWKYVVAILPVLGLGFVLHNWVEVLQQNIVVVALASIVVALVMTVIQHMRKSTLLSSTHQLNWTDSVWIGFGQALSLIPGVSRSGITVASGIWRKLSFEEATKTAFMLAIPVMAAASGFEVLKFALGKTVVEPGIVGATAIGFVVAFFTALLSIRFTLPIFRKFGFTPFIVYRILFGLLLLLTLK